MKNIIITLAAVLFLAGGSLAFVNNDASATTTPMPTPTPADTISGKYEGVAKSQAFGDMQLTIELTNTGGKLSGSINSAQGPAAITEGSYVDGKVSIKFDASGNEGWVAATVKDGTLAGTWGVAGAEGTIEAKKAGSTPPPPSAPTAPPAPPAKPAAADIVSGEWNASADVQGNSIPFTLKLKLEGEKVTGESSSSQGTAAVSNGKWDGSKLSFSLDSPNGTINMTGVIKDGKINGDFDLGGQMSGTWSAAKK